MRQFFFNFTKFFYLYKKKHPKRVMTVLVFIVIPLITGMILGYEMSSNVAMHIPTVVVDHDHSEFSRNFIQYVSESEYFNVIEQSENDERIEEAIYRREAFVGVIIPEGFYQDLRDGKAPKIMTIYDGSTLAAVSYSSSALTEIIETLKTGYMMKVYEGKLGVVPADVMNHVIPIDVTYRMLFNPERNFRNFILPGMLAALIQVGISCMGAERAGELRGKNVKFTEHLKVIVHWGALGAMSIGITLLEQILIFDMPYKSTVLGGALLTFTYSTAVLTAGYLIGSVISDRTFAAQVAAVIVLPTTILGGYTWPVIAMPGFFQQLAKIIPFYYYGSEIRSLCLSTLEFRHVIPVIGIMCAFIGVETVLLYLVKRREAIL
jgi:ABC-2 type transport system permease protein